MNEMEKQIISKVNKFDIYLYNFESLDGVNKLAENYSVSYFPHFFIENCHELKRMKILSDEEINYCLNNINYKKFNEFWELPLSKINPLIQERGFIEMVINKTNFYYHKEMRETIGYTLIKMDLFEKIDLKLIEKAVDMAKSRKVAPLFVPMIINIVEQKKKSDFIPIKLQIKILTKDGYFRFKNNQIIEGKNTSDCLFYVEHYKKMDSHIAELNSILLKKEIGAKVGEAEKTVKHKI